MRLPGNLQPPTKRKFWGDFDSLIMEPRNNNRVKPWNLGSASKVLEGFEESEELEVSTEPLLSCGKKLAYVCSIETVKVPRYNFIKEYRIGVCKGYISRVLLNQ